MRTDDRQAEPESPDPRVRFAERLVAALGRDGAVRACRENGWDGILAILRGDPRRRPR